MYVHTGLRAWDVYLDFRARTFTDKVCNSFTMKFSSLTLFKFKIDFKYKARLIFIHNDRIAKMRADYWNVIKINKRVWNDKIKEKILDQTFIKKIWLDLGYYRLFLYRFTWHYRFFFGRCFMPARPVVFKWSHLFTVFDSGVCFGFISALEPRIRVILPY